MPTQSSQARLAALLRDVQSRLGDPLDLASMARQFGASQFHFHRLFRESTGETPRQHIERLRLEHALLRVAVTNDNIMDIGHAVGFRHPETFTRSFKRYFRLAPIEMRQLAQFERDKRLQTATAPASDQCRLSEVRIETLRPGFLLAKRRVGEYAKFDNAPFTKSDRLWNPLARWAALHKVPHAKTGWGFTHDIPGITPPEAQRFDACVRVTRAVRGSRGIQCIEFAGGTYAAIDHVGPASTLMTAYSRIVHVMNLAPHKYAYRVGPSLTIYRSVHIGGNPQLNRTTVCMPVIRRQNSKKHQGAARRSG